MKESTDFTFVNRTGQKLIRGVSVRCLDSFWWKHLLLRSSTAYCLLPLNDKSMTC